MNTKTLAKISKIINKMGVSAIITDFNENTTEVEMGKKIAGVIIDNLYKVEDEIIDLIMQIKGISKEEAENVDVIEFFSELFKDEKIQSFLHLM